MKEIACIIMAGIGDSILIDPALKDIKERFPKSKLTIIVNSNSIKDILKTNPYIDNFYVLGPRPKSLKDKIKFWIKYKNWEKMIDLKKKNFDIVYSFSKGKQEKIFLKIIRPKKKEIYKDRTGERIKNNILLVNGKSDRSFPKIFLQKGEEEESIKIRRRIKSNKLVGIHPGCGKGSEFKRWPIEKFVDLADKLKEEGSECMFFLGPDEETLEEEIKKSQQKHILIKGKDIRETITYLDACDVFVYNVSGLMHIANALDKKIIALRPKEDEKIKDLKTLPLKKGMVYDINTTVKKVMKKTKN